MNLNKTSFYILSFTWGILLTLFGCLSALVLCICGKRPARFCWCSYLKAGNDSWGGIEGGPFFVTDSAADSHILRHEYGHAIQNCFFGPLMIPLVCIPSSLRYFYRKAARKRGKQFKRGYDDIWFERQATELGTRYALAFEEKHVDRQNTV